MEIRPQRGFQSNLKPGKTWNKWIPFLGLEAVRSNRKEPGFVQVNFYMKYELGLWGDSKVTWNLKKTEMSGFHF